LIVCEVIKEGVTKQLIEVISSLPALPLEGNKQEQQTDPIHKDEQ
jgi:hypothetical protein